MKDIKYTIITCTYNAEKHVDRYFKFVNELKGIPVEIIIVDDCSTDDTYKRLLDKTSDNYEGLSIYRTETNCGPGIARNLGLKHSRGEFVLFVDIDDYLDPAVFTDIKEYKDYDIVYFNYNKVIKGKKYANDSLRLHKSQEVSVEYLLKATNGCVWGKVFKGSIIRNYNIEFPSLYKSEDLVFMYRYLILCNNAFYLSNCYYNYYINMSSIMHTNKHNQIDYSLKAMKILNGVGLPNDVYDILYCKEIIYDNTNVMLQCGYQQKDVLLFWDHNPIPKHWHEYSKYFTSFQMLVLNMIDKKHYNVLKLIVTIKGLIS